MGAPKIDWHDDWIIENYLKYKSYKAMAADYSELFGIHCKSVSIKCHALKLGLHKPKVIGKPYTDEQNEWLKDYYPTHGVMDTVRTFNKIFCESRTRSAIKNWARVHDITVNRDIWIKNHMYGLHGEKSKRAMKNEGDSRIECGRQVIKKENGSWDQAGRVIYEKQYGPIPKGYCIVHLNGNCLDNAIENLAAIPTNVLGVLGAYHMIYEDQNLTRLSIEWAKLHLLLRQYYTKRKCNKLGI